MTPQRFWNAAERSCGRLLILTPVSSAIASPRNPGMQIRIGGQTRAKNMTAAQRLEAARRRKLPRKRVN